MNSNIKRISIKRISNGLSDKERKEFNGLKRIKSERGYWLPDEQERYYLLWDINATGVMEALNAFDLLSKQEELN